MNRFTMTAGAALAGVVLLAGCTQGAAKRSSAGGGGGVFDAAQRQNSAPGAAASPAARQPAGSAKQPVKAGGAAKALVTPAALIRTADLVVEIEHGSDVAARANRAEQIAVAAGGQVYADERTAGTTPTAALTLKVPGPALVSVLGQLATLGTEKSRHSSTQDVTGEVADVDSRVRSAKASIDRVRVLFSQATRVADVIALESELSQREADLESLQAQQRSFASRTAMATVTLNLASGVPVITHKSHPKSGFLGGLDRGWRTFTGAAGSVATAIGTALPFLALALLVLGAAVAVRRRSRRAAAPVIAPPDAA